MRREERGETPDPTILYSTSRPEACQQKMNPRSSLAGKRQLWRDAARKNAALYRPPCRFLCSAAVPFHMVRPVKPVLAHIKKNGGGLAEEERRRNARAPLICLSCTYILTMPRGLSIKKTLLYWLFF
jgi:hypothetical protein